MYEKTTIVIIDVSKDSIEEGWKGVTPVVARK